MATKTISLRLEAYERLRHARRFPDESFSEVILRATWPEQTLTGEELLVRCREHGPFFTEDELDRIAELKRDDQAPQDKWAAH
jgi:predicted CopG family antitoxin